MLYAWSATAMLQGPPGYLDLLIVIPHWIFVDNDNGQIDNSK